MRLPTKDQVRYHGIRWVWVVLLAALAYVAFPSSATNVEPLPVGTPADHDVVAPFTFPVNKSDEELAREAERSEEHTSELQSPCNLVCRLLLEKKKQNEPHIGDRVRR